MTTSFPAALYDPALPTSEPSPPSQVAGTPRPPISCPNQDRPPSFAWTPGTHIPPVLGQLICAGETRGNPILALKAEFRAWSSPHQPGASGEAQASHARHCPWHHIRTSFSANRVSERLLLSLGHPTSPGPGSARPHPVLLTVASSSQIIMGTFCSSLLSARGRDHSVALKGASILKSADHRGGHVRTAKMGRPRAPEPKARSWP